MEPATVGVRLASSVATPLIKKLFTPEGPGAGLVDKPVRISSRVSFKGEQRTLGEKDVTRLASELVRRALKDADERPVAPDEAQPVVHALADTLRALGDITMTDAQAVALGHSGLALHLRHAAGSPDRDLDFDATLFYERLLDTACLHILHFFTQRSTFVARTLVEQTRRQSELIAKVDELIARTPRPGDGDEAFERRYLAYAATKHSQLTIYGIDLANTPDRWPLDTAYLTLQALRPATSDEDGRYIASPGTPLPADEALAEQDLVLLRGVAGSGKTTLVQWLAVTAARGERGDRIPFVLPLRTLVRRPDGLPAPAGFLAAVRVPFHDAAPDAWPDRVLTAGRGLLLVDGIDEIPESDRERTRRWLRDLIDAYPGNQWLVTSRPSAVREDWLAADGFTELTLSPMSREDVTAFVERWHRAARIGAPDTERLTAYETSLLDAVRTKPDLGRLATNPLMCGLICALHRDRRGYLPHGRQELYDAALSMLLSRRDQERDMLPHDDIRLTELPQIQLLQRLAYWLIRNNQAEMDRERAERLIADALPSLPAAASQGDATAIHRHLLVRSGLLREPTLGTVEFVHRTFQDYLGAKAAVEDGDFGLLVRNAADSQWSDVIRMAVAHARPRERAGFLRDLLAAASDERTDPAASTRICLLALAGLEHATELDPQVRADVEEQAATLIPPRTVEEAKDLASVGPLVLELLPGPEGLSDAEARAVVVTASLVDTDESVPVLARFRGHPAISVRTQLTWTWHRFDTERYAAEVIAHLPQDDLYFAVHSAAHLRALHALGGRPQLQLVGDIEAAALRAHLPPDTTRLLIMRNNHSLRDLDCLSPLHRLWHLDLSDGPHVEDLAPLAALPLKWLSLDQMKGLEKPHALAPLSASATLRELDTGVPLQADSLDAALPRGLALTYLRFTRNALRFTGLRGLRHMRSVKTLSLANLLEPLTPEDYEEVALLPELRELRLNWTAVPWTAGPVLPGIERLHFNKFTGNEDLSAVPALFPGLRSVTFALDPDTSEVPAEVLELFPGTHAVMKSHTVL
ncbi:NACHT domain-containing protein [Streptomyces phaeochromogenes]|uniref:NACHT domain-containing protein n=1 Tax=Streptomyces phaeochromogenes TaxID=1923 RepID=A0ABZ1HFN6_STRPH|nr:NACHT domain-containing protein [Streptomyces phaeochromogenes]WSD17015.1 NACHT domain-containing protein [Streptomyces phaeochromogenes]